METLIDSYTTNPVGNAPISSADFLAYGVSFVALSTEYTLSSCVFKMAKYGSPTGSAYAKLYAHTGTYGSSGIPTGSALATSDALSVSGLPEAGSVTDKTFTFSTPYTLEPNTYYFVVVNYTGGSSENVIYVYFNPSSPTHDGNNAYLIESSWSYRADRDCYFKVYGNAVNTFSPQLMICS